MFAVRRELVEALLADKDWSHKLEEAKTNEEALSVLTNFAKKHGYKIEYLEERK